MHLNKLQNINPYSLKLVHILCAIMVSVVVGGPGISFATPDSEYEALKARYMRLRNTDREVAKEPQWLGIVAELEGFSRKNKTFKNAPVAVSQAAGMLLEMYKVLGKKEYLDRSTALFELITTEFKGSGEGDDALIKLSEIYSVEFNDKEKAVASLDKLVAEYPNGDMYEAALIRKKQLTSTEDDDDEEQDATQQGSSRDAVTAGKLNVIIDPGHGGEDFGAVGVGGLYEKDVVLDISHKLKDVLEKKYGLKAALTRDTDEFVPLYERTGVANESGAEVFVSIHANASEKKNLHGLEIFYLDNTSDKASKKLADRENASMQFEGPEADLRYMLSDLIQDTKLSDSIKLAGVLGGSIIGGLGSKGIEMRNLGTKKAPFYVLVGAFMPCVLVEIGFIDHQQEGQKLADKNFRVAMADSFASGISKFLAKN